MLKYTCGIFDLDGTLLNTLLDLEACVNGTLEHFDLPKRTRREVRSFLGSGRKDLLMKASGLPDGDRLREICTYYDGLYGANYKNLTCPYEGIAEMLEKLQSAGVKLAVLSNKGQYLTAPLIAKCLPQIHFEVVFGQRPGVALKPEAGAVYEILDKIGVTPAETLYFGDSDVDIQTAKNAGVAMGIVSWGYRDRELLLQAGAESLIDSPEEIPALFGIR